MRRFLFTTALALAPLACGCAKEKKAAHDPAPTPVASAAGEDKKAAHEPAPTPAASAAGEDKKAAHDPTPAASSGSEKATGAPAAPPAAKPAEPEPPPLPHAGRKDDPTVLIPGDPPLTQGMWDRYADVWEWILDLRLTKQQRTQWQSLCMDSWKKKDDTGKAQYVSWIQRISWIQQTVKLWDDMAKLSEAERDLQRLQLQGSWGPDLVTLRKSSDPEDQMLMTWYDEAHKPGGERNPILVASDPPFTQDMMDLYRMAMEYVLDLHLTDRQRDEFQRVCIEDWKKDNDHKGWAKGIELWRKPLSGSPYNRRVLRVRERPIMLANLRKTKYEDERWLLAAYEAAQADNKPGGEHNPILVDGDPPLTRDTVVQYCDMVEAAVDLSISGGLTADQRQYLQDLLVRDWKTTDKPAKEAFLQQLQKAPDLIALVGQLRTPGDERNKYLVKLHEHEQQLFAATSSANQSSKHDAMMSIINNFAPSGYYVPDR